jgi:hypothetical protein
MKKYIKKTLYIEPKHDKHIVSKTSSKTSESEIVRQLIEKDMQSKKQ